MGGLPKIQRESVIFITIICQGWQAGPQGRDEGCQKGLFSRIKERGGTGLAKGWLLGLQTTMSLVVGLWACNS